MIPVLSVQGLTKVYGLGCPLCLETTGLLPETNHCRRCGSVVACAGVDFEVLPGEILGIVGESGSGKSTVLACLALQQVATAGCIFLNQVEGGSRNVLELSPHERRRLRHAAIGVVHQNPHMGLRMDYSAGANVAESLLTAGWRHYGRMRERAIDLLEHVEMDLERTDDWPIHFSGGMQQRVQIAKALANGPAVLLLDEPTGGLDVSVQARLLDLLREISRRLEVAMILVSHDLGVIRILTERTLVMRYGRVIEAGLTDQIIEDPQEPYTQLLVHSTL